MKDYRNYKHVSTSMRHDLQLIKNLEDLANAQTINYVVETGTFNGLGSTTMIAKAFEGSSILKKLFTIEINYSNYNKAKKNLRHFRFVNCLYGCSVDPKEAIDFVKHDQAILDHEAYPDIFIDFVADPVAFYIYELRGGQPVGKIGIVKRLLRKRRQSNLLRKLLTKYFDQNLLIVLDSAGGIGQMEFNLVTEVMRERPHFLLLDDIHHLKHFRSYEQIRNNAKYKIIDVSTVNGWLLAKYM